jgi:hypothetical protein
MYIYSYLHIGFGCVDYAEQSFQTRLNKVELNYMTTQDCTSPPQGYSVNDITGNMMCAVENFKSIVSFIFFPIIRHSQSIVFSISIFVNSQLLLLTLTRLLIHSFTHLLIYSFTHIYISF